MVPSQCRQSHRFLTELRKVLGTLATTAAVVASGVILAPAASAGTYGCGGSEIDSYAVKTNGGTQYATVHLFYDSSTKRNCAVNVATSAGGYGTSGFMLLHLAECSGITLSSCTDSPITTDDDGGNYSYYAGPVSVPAAGHCILVSASREYNGVNAGTQHGPVHCS
ncbi:hypothetical protein ACF09H_07085 [Streptomyces sp. NPDC014983]|uniref:hypothetical protein n=1 Tax=Streptomyces sp. NPDC014983 TaxID=3364933 RepID=UPI0036FA95C8